MDFLQVPKNIQEERYKICEGCDQFINLTKQCKKCYCFMPVKTKFRDAACPMLKWDKWERTKYTD